MSVSITSGNSVLEIMSRMVDFQVISEWCNMSNNWSGKSHIDVDKIYM